MITPQETSTNSPDHQPGTLNPTSLRSQCYSYGIATDVLGSVSQTSCEVLAKKVCHLSSDSWKGLP